MMNTNYEYQVALDWKSGTLGLLQATDIEQSIDVATPPEFLHGMKDKWTPEHLFVAAVNACLMSTFLLVAENSKFTFLSYHSRAIGKVEKVQGKFSVTEIILTPMLLIEASADADKALRILEMSEKACAIANSVLTKIILKPEVKKQ
jgi:organic hydroperoxide reductase OsmC/OhrA